MCFKTIPCREMKVNTDFDTACLCLYVWMSSLKLSLVQNAGFVFLFQMEYPTT